LKEEPEAMKERGKKGREKKKCEKNKKGEIKERSSRNLRRVQKKKCQY